MKSAHPLFEISKTHSVDENSALIIIDYTEQNATHEVPEWGLTLNKVKKIHRPIINLINFCRNKKVPIVFIGTKEWVEGNLPPNINHLYKTNPDAAFYKAGNDKFIIPPTNNDIVLFKNSYSAFSGTNNKLHRKLKSMKIDRLIICGIFSTGCVNNTIVEGFAKGYHITVIKDCVETFDRNDKQTYQNILFADWSYMYGQVLTLNEFKKTYK